MDKKGFQLCNEIDAEELNKDWSGYNASQKYDGMRLQVIKKGTDVRMISRDGVADNWKYPEIIDALSKVENDFIIDGELCVLNEKGISDFNLMVSRLHTKDKFKIKLLSSKYPSTFIAFDILELNNEDLTTRPLIERYTYLNKLTQNKCFKITSFTDDVKSLYKQAMEYKWEGIIIKKNDSQYKGERNNDWIKVKRKEYVVINFISYEQNNKGICLISKEDVRVQCSGEQHKKVKEEIDTFGFAKCEICRLGGKTFNGAHRQPTFSRLIK